MSHRPPCRLVSPASRTLSGHALPRGTNGADTPAEIITVRVTTTSRTAKPALRGPAHDGRGCEAATRPVFFDGAWRDTSVVLRTPLTAGVGVEGPALVEEMESVTVVPPSRRMEVGADGEFHLVRNRGVESTA